MTAGTTAIVEPMEIGNSKLMKNICIGPLVFQKKLRKDCDDDSSPSLVVVLVVLLSISASRRSSEDDESKLCFFIRAAQIIFHSF